MRRAVLAALALAAALVAPPALAAPQGSAGAANAPIDAQARCLAKQLRKHGGPEGGRAAALKAHFECFPTDPQRFVALFVGDGDAAGPLAADHSAHLELFFAARGAVSEREWSASAIGVLAGGAWRPGAIDFYADLLLLQLRARPPALLDAAGRLDDAALESFWRALFGNATEFAPDAAVCAGREVQRACAVLTTLGAPR